MQGGVATSLTHQVERDHLNSDQAHGDGNLPEDGSPPDQVHTAPKPLCISKRKAFLNIITPPKKMTDFIAFEN